MEILRKVRCSERLPENNMPVYLHYGNCHGVYYRRENQWVKQNTQNKERLSVLEYPEPNNYWYEPIEIELKSEEILPIENRDRHGNNYGKTYVTMCLDALEAAELELAEYKAKEGQLGKIINKLAQETAVLKDENSKLEDATDILYTEEDLEEDRNNLRAEFIELVESLQIENQGLKLAIENNHGGNCIIAPKEEVDKVAKERYDEAFYSLGENFDKKWEDWEVIEALKIAAGIE